MNTKIALAATAALLLTGTVASVSVAQQATDEGERKGGMSREVTLDRVLTGAEKMFNLIDANNDGVLSQDEIDAGPQRPGRLGKMSMDDLPLTGAEAEAKLAEVFVQMDADGNGTVTRAERAAFAEAKMAETGVTAQGMTLEDFTARGMRPFNKVDADGDGTITEDEVAAIQEKMSERRGGQKAGKDGKRGGKDGKGMGRKGGRGGQLIKAFLGEDGLTAGMTWEDLQAKVTEAFNGIDADGSGTLTRDEIKPIVQEMRAAKRADRNNG